MVKDGIRINVYDMLDQRRIRNREKRKRRKERKAQAAEEATEAQEHQELKAKVKSDNESETTDAGNEPTNLHEILGSWTSHEAKSEKKSSTDIPFKKPVDFKNRDSQRIDSFMSALFPDFSNFRSETVSSSMSSSSSSSNDVTPNQAAFVASEGHFVNNPWSPSLLSDALEDSDDEDMLSDILTVKPEVRRFEVSSEPPTSNVSKLKTTKRTKIEKFPGRISGDVSILRKETRYLERDCCALPFQDIEKEMLQRKNYSLKSFKEFKGLEQCSNVQHISARSFVTPFPCAEAER